MIRKLRWYFKQLLPMTYVTQYGLGGKQVVCAWKMWFGKCYRIRQWTVVS